MQVWLCCMLCCLTLWLGAPSGVDGKIDEAIVRTLTHEEQGHSTTIYSDGVSYLVVEFNEFGQIIDCDFTKEFSATSRGFLKEVMENGGRPTDQKVVPMDLARLGRKCKKWQRDIVRGEDPALLQVKDEARSFSKLLTFVPGTSHCVVRADSSAIQSTGGEANECCKQMHKCKFIVDGYSTKYDMFNPYPFSLLSCDCLETLRTCLAKVKDTTAASSVQNLYFSRGYRRCVEPRREHRCLAWNQWGTVCMNSEETDVAVLKFLV